MEESLEAKKGDRGKAWKEEALSSDIFRTLGHFAEPTWTGTNSSVLEWFYHANALRQLHFTRFRGGFEEFVCTKLSFLRKLSLIRI